MYITHIPYVYVHGLQANYTFVKKKGKEEILALSFTYIPNI